MFRFRVKNILLGATVLLAAGFAAQTSFAMAGSPGASGSTGTTSGAASSNSGSTGGMPGSETGGGAASPVKPEPRQKAMTQDDLATSPNNPDIEAREKTGGDPIIEDKKTEDADPIVPFERKTHL